MVSTVRDGNMVMTNTHLHICPLCNASDPVTWVGGSVIPSDGRGSLAEGAGLIGCDGWPSNTEGLLLNCLGFRGLGELLCWLPSGGGERALKLVSLTLDDMGLEGRAVRKFPVSSLSTCMTVDSSCLLKAMLTARSDYFPPKTQAGL